MSLYARYGEKKYIRAYLPDVTWRYCYSAEDLEKELNDFIAGQKLKAIYTDLYGYPEATIHTDRIDCSYMGEITLIVFEKTVLELEINVEGVIKYRHFPIWEMKRRTFFDFVPDDMGNTEKYFYDIADGGNISFDYTDREMKSVTVKKTDSWGFAPWDFDETLAARAAKNNDLPAEIVFNTEICAIRFLGDYMEYYYIYFEEPTPS